MRQIRTQDDIKAGLEQLLQSDPRLISIADQVEEVPLRLAAPGFHGLANIIVSQQVSKASAAAIFGRLEKLVDPFTAENYLGAGESAWIEAGLSRAKQKTFVNVCEAIGFGNLDLDAICNIEPEDALSRLTSIKGIGPWTAEVYLLFCAGHPDIFPAGDVALQEAARAGFGLDCRPDDKQLRVIAQDWAPWRGVAARLLWAYYAVLKGGRGAMPV